MTPSACDNPARRAAALALCLLLLLLAACGQKGDLYIPEPPDPGAAQAEGTG